MELQDIINSVLAHADKPSAQAPRQDADATDYEALANVIIRQGFDRTVEENTIRARDLKTSEIPNKRDTKKKHRRHSWRGESFSDKPGTIFEDVFKAESAWTRMPTMGPYEWNGHVNTRRVWSGDMEGTGGRAH